MIRLANNAEGGGIFFGIRTLRYQSSSSCQVVMADVTADSCILNQESCIQAEAPEEKTNQAEPTEESRNEGEEREGCEEREEQEKCEEREGCEEREEQEKREEREGCEGREEQEEREECSNSNIYPYIKEDLFTSEIFKVKIQNLPKYICFNDLKKFLNKHGLNPHKIKLMGKESFAFVTFKNQKDRDEAMKLVHGVQWKGKVLSVRLAKPKADPLIRKRRLDEEAADAGQPAAKRPAEGHDAAEDEPLSVQIANAVTPLWQVPYDEQLRRKEREVEEVLHTLTREIGNSNKAMLPWLFLQKEKNNGASIISYRNKASVSRQTCDQRDQKCARQKCRRTLDSDWEIGNSNKAMLPWLFLQKEKNNGASIISYRNKASVSRQTWNKRDQKCARQKCRRTLDSD
ncbi:hypothetical protein PGIGA_G00151410 [Pangasianodon gigas]|uniref:Uncharacterized protein n=1 Tax=Pangasianodon gigas TaxID=30993 RepID=A0ACC5XNW8_PANGG|nr:hypothetical protein [Pangasianodon gigas]